MRGKFKPQQHSGCMHGINGTQVACMKIPPSARNRIRLHTCMYIRVASMNGNTELFMPILLHQYSIFITWYSGAGQGLWAQLRAIASSAAWSRPAHGKKYTHGIVGVARVCNSCRVLQAKKEWLKKNLENIKLTCLFLLTKITVLSKSSLSHSFNYKDLNAIHLRSKLFMPLGQVPSRDSNSPVFSKGAHYPAHMYMVARVQ